MKKLIPIIIMLISLSSFSQNRDKMRERIKAQKIAFITERLSLTSEEAQQFWPIYNGFVNAVEKIKSEDLNPIKKEMRHEEVSEKRANEILKTLLAAETKIHELKLGLASDLKDVISSKKIILLKASEDEFNRILLQRLKEMRQKRENKN